MHGLMRGGRVKPAPYSTCIFLYFSVFFWCSRCIEKLLESMGLGQGFVGEGQGEGYTTVKAESGNWRREQRVEKLRKGDG